VSTAPTPASAETGPPAPAPPDGPVPWPAGWTAVLAVCGVELRRLSRDRVGLFFLVVLPFVLILAIGVAFPADTDAVRVGVVAGETDGIGGSLLATFEAADGLDVTRYDEVREVVRDIRLGELDAGIVIPADLTGTVDAGGDGEVVLELDPAQRSSSMLRNMVGSVVEDEALVLTAARFAESTAGAAQAEALAAAREQVELLARGEVRTVTVGGGSGVPVSGFAFTAAAQMILFMFINSVAGASSLVEMRTLGVADRAMSAPIDVTGLIGGLTLSRFLVAFGQGVLIAVVSWVLFDVDWGDGLVLGAVVVLFALVSAGAGVLIGSLARTPDQAPAIGVPLALAMAALGGCFFPLSVAPVAMQVVARVLTPHAWATDALLDGIFDGAGPADVVVNLAVLAGFAALYLSVGVVMLRRRLERR
jgi:ABC-2 type transport system permease protein